MSGHTHLRGHVEDGLAWIEFFAVFAKASGVNFDGDVVDGAGLEEFSEECATVFFRIKAKFLGEVGVADDLEEPGRRSLVRRSK